MIAAIGLAIAGPAPASEQASGERGTVRMARATWDTGWFQAEIYRALPEVAARFDTDGDGSADLLGCEVGWSCGEIIDHHLDTLGLRDTVTHVQGDYNPLLDSLIERQARGDPVLFYTWTPNWTVGELVPGEDVMWLNVDESTEAGSPAGEGEYAVSGVPGCAEPCRPGWPPNDIRVVANSEFLNANPVIRWLLEQVQIPLDDIADQNARMRAGEGSPEDIRSLLVRRGRVIWSGVHVALDVADEDQMLTSRRVRDLDH